MMSAFEIARPEIFLLIAACVVLLLDLFVGKNARVVTYLATQASLLTTALLIYSSSFNQEMKVVGLDRMYVLDELAGFLKISIVGFAMLSFIYARKYLRDQNLWRGEFFVLGMTSVLGMLIMSSGYNLLVLYLGLEVLSLSMYALVALHRDNGKAIEAAMKYFILGAVGSGMLLYGMSLLYGISGGLGVDHLSTFFNAQPANDVKVLFALTFIVAGLAFKLGAVPFHMWLPDVYQGAPTAVTLFLGSAPKVAAFALVMRILAEGLGSVEESWSQMLMVLGLLSIIVGNLFAVAQHNMKRMLAYSTISHMGFIIMGVITSSHIGYSAAMFYVVTYALMSAAAFALLILLSRTGYEAETLDDLKGLNERSPWLAFLVMLMMLSMMGFPLTVGFYSKLAVIQAVVGKELVWPAVIMVVMSVVGAFYYLRVLKLMYFEKPADNTTIDVGIDFYGVLSVNSLLLLGLGVFPGGLMALCSAVLSASQL